MSVDCCLVQRQKHLYRNDVYYFHPDVEIHPCYLAIHYCSNAFWNAIPSGEVWEMFSAFFNYGKVPENVFPGKLCNLKLMVHATN